jgi:glycosyltransferase involved in cell wall biosynthesis
MKVTVIIATYNAEKYVGRAIRSVIDQSFPKTDYEIIVVDDGSTDRTTNILESFGDWINVISLKENRGIGYACNQGIRKALSPYVVRVDADDYVHEDLLKVEYLYLSMNKQLDAVACDYLVVDERESPIGRRNAHTDPIACGIMFRKDNLVSIGLYDESFPVREDEDLRIRYLQQFNIERIELPLYRYRLHESNITKNTEAMQYYKNMLNEKHGSIGPSDT